LEPVRKAGSDVDNVRLLTGSNGRGGPPNPPGGSIPSPTAILEPPRKAGSDVDNVRLLTGQPASIAQFGSTISALLGVALPQADAEAVHDLTQRSSVPSGSALA
jgi:hypothetical protein